MGIIVGPANSEAVARQLNNSHNFFTSIRIVGKHVFQTEGLRGFWRGLTPCIVRNGGGSAVYFHTLRELERRTAHNEHRHKLHFINSALARIASTIIINPFAVVGSRLEVPGFNQYRSLWHGLSTMYQ